MIKLILTYNHLVLIVLGRPNTINSVYVTYTKNLRVKPFQTPFGHLGPPSGHFRFYKR